MGWQAWQKLSRKTTVPVRIQKILGFESIVLIWPSVILKQHLWLSDVVTGSPDITLFADVKMILWTFKAHSPKWRVPCRSQFATSMTTSTIPSNNNQLSCTAQCTESTARISITSTYLPGFHMCCRLLTAALCKCLHIFSLVTVLWTNQ